MTDKSDEKPPLESEISEEDAVTRWLNDDDSLCDQMLVVDSFGQPHFDQNAIAKRFKIVFDAERHVRNIYQKACIEREKTVEEHKEIKIKLEETCKELEQINWFYENMVPIFTKSLELLQKTESTLAVQNIPAHPTVLQLLQETAQQIGTMKEEVAQKVLSLKAFQKALNP